MYITQHLATLPLWLSALLVVGVTTVTAMVCSFSLRRLVPADHLIANNEVAGFKFATVGVIYAVMLGFAVIVVWERFHDAEAAEIQEAGAVLALHRLSNGMESAAGAMFRDRLTAYAKTVIDDDWPAMARGELSPKTTHALNDVYAAALTDATRPGRGQAVLSEIFGELDQVAQARRERAVLAGGVVPGVVWLVLSLGAVLTIGFTMFFGSRNLRAQVMMTGMLSALVFLALWVIIVIDYPFTGPVSVSPESLVLVMHEFAGGR